MENKPESLLVVSLEKAHIHIFMWKTGDPAMATPQQVRTSRPKDNNKSLSREWRANIAKKKKIRSLSVKYLAQA